MANDASLSVVSNLFLHSRIILSFNNQIWLYFLYVTAQESGGSPCPSSCPDLNKSQTLSSLSESGAVLVEVCCLLVLAVDNKVFFICGFCSLSHNAANVNRLYSLNTEYYEELVSVDEYVTDILMFLFI